MEVLENAGLASISVGPRQCWFGFASCSEDGAGTIGNQRPRLSYRIVHLKTRAKC